MRYNPDGWFVVSVGESSSDVIPVSAAVSKVFFTRRLS